MPGLYYAGTDTPVPPEDLQRALDAGEVEADNSGPTILRDASGNRVSIAPEEAANMGSYLRQGFIPESAEETDLMTRMVDAERSPIQAGAESLVQGATLGLYGAAAGQLDREYAENMLMRREGLGGVGTALEVAGAVVPSFVTGGAFTPAGLLARGAGAAGKSLENALVSRGVGAGLSRVAGMAAEGTLDGAVSGAMAQLSEDSLGGTDITAERLAASGALGALFGLGAGAGVAGLGVGAGKLGSKVTDRIRSRAATEATEAVGDATSRAGKDAGFMRFVPDRIQEAWGDLAETSGRATKKEALDVLNDSQARSEWLRAGAVKDDANKRLRDAMEKVYRNDIHLRSAGAGEVHAENLAELLPQRPQDAFKARAESQSVFEKLKGELEADGVADLLEKKRFGRLARDVGFFEQKVGKAFESGDMVAGNVALANFKRALWKHAENAAKARPGSGFAREAEQWVQDYAQRAEKEVRLLLEREDVFGAAGRNQKARNAAWKKAIDSGKEANSLISRETNRQMQGTDEWWRHERIVDGDKLAKQINNIDNPNSEYETRVIGEHLRDLDEAYSQFKANGEIPAKQAKQFDEAHAAIREARETFDEISQKVKKFNLLDALEGADKDRSKLVQSVTSPGTLGVLGGFVGGGFGAAAGAALGTVASIATSPGAMVREVTKLEALQRRIAGVQQSTQAKTVRAVRRLAMPKASRRKLQSNAARAATRYFGQSEAKKKAAAAKVEQRLTEFQAEATRLAEAVQYQVNGMDKQPKLTFAYAHVANRAAQFLQSKLPAPTTAPNRLQPQFNTSNWTSQDVDRFTKYLAAIKDPDSVLEDLEAGRLSPESVEAVKAVYPTLFAEMQVGALQEIAKQGKKMPFDSVIQLSLMLDIEGHPLFNPQMQATMKQVTQQTQEQAQQQAAKPAPGRTIKQEQGYLARISSL